MNFDAEDKHMFAWIVGLRLRSDLWNGDPPGAEVTQLVSRHFITWNIIKNFHLTESFRDLPYVSIQFSSVTEFMFHAVL